MCLIVFAWQQHKDYDLIVGANRDEFHLRPTQKAGWWPDYPELLAGRDLQAGGTWLGVTRSGRFATITNYREQSFTRGSYRSRGALVSDFLLGVQSPDQFSTEVDGDGYAGFNLLTADVQSMSYVSNRGDAMADMPPGIYGLSNASLDTAWSKVNRSKAQLRGLIDSDNVNETTLLRILADRQTATEDVNSEHLSFDQAKAITAPFIVTSNYGTRCSTLILRRRDGKTDFIEQRFDATGAITGTSRFSF